MFWTADGHPFPVDYWAHPVMRNGQLIGSVVAFSDITERIKVQNEQQLAAQVFDSSREAIVITDADNRIITVNQAFTKITGYSPAEVQGQNPRILASGEHGSDFYAAMWQSITANGHWQGEIWNRRKSGEIYPEWLSISRVRDVHGNLTHYIAIFADISELKAADEHIRFLAQHDALTGLPNRILVGALLGDFTTSSATSLWPRSTKSSAHSDLPMPHWPVYRSTTPYASTSVPCWLVRSANTATRYTDNRYTKSVVESRVVSTAVSFLEATSISTGAPIPVLMLMGAVLNNLSLIMIFLSRALKYRVNRWVNIFVGVFTIAYIWGGKVPYPHYTFIATVETICLLLIIVKAWKWTDQDA